MAEVPGASPAHGAPSPRGHRRPSQQQDLVSPVGNFSGVTETQGQTGSLALLSNTVNPFTTWSLRGALCLDKLGHSRPERQLASLEFKKMCKILQYRVLCKLLPHIHGHWLLPLFRTLEGGHWESPWKGLEGEPCCAGRSCPWIFWPFFLSFLFQVSQKADPGFFENKNLQK